MSELGPSDSEGQDFHFPDKNTQEMRNEPGITFEKKFLAGVTAAKRD